MCNDKKVKYSIKKPLKAYCPVMDVTLTIGSELLDQMGEFTRYILYLIGQGYTIEDINEIIELGEFIIHEEVDYIDKIGLIQQSEYGYILTEIGQKYFNLLFVLDELNKQGIKAQLNCFNGYIYDSDWNTLTYKECDDNYLKLRVKIIKELYQNRNPANSKEYILNKFSNMIKANLKEDEIEKLYVSLSYERSDKYKEIFIKEASSIKENQSELEEADIIIVHNVIPFKIRAEFLELQEYRNVLSTLKNLKLFDFELISQKASNLLELEDEEKFINSINNQKIYYYDELTSEITEEIAQTFFAKEISTIRDINAKGDFKLSQEKLQEIFGTKIVKDKKVFLEIIKDESIEYFERITSTDYI